MYKYVEVLNFLSTLSMPTVWANRAAVAARAENDILLWNSLRHGLQLKSGAELELLKPFEK